MSGSLPVQKSVKSGDQEETKTGLGRPAFTRFDHHHRAQRPKPIAVEALDPLPRGSSRGFL
jgi:hypothetical protein